MNTEKIKAAIRTAKDMYAEVFEGLSPWRWILSALVLIVFGIALALLWIMFWLLEKIAGNKP